MRRRIENVPCGGVVPVLSGIAIVLSALLFSCAGLPEKIEAAYQVDDFSAVVDGRARDALKDRRIEGGLSLGVYSRGEIVVARGYGYADKEEGHAITGSTPMPVGSVSKTFTGIAVMQLVERGALRLEDPLSMHIPDLKLPAQAEQRITVEMLLTHRSGVQGDILSDFITREQVEPSEFQRRILGLLGNRPLLFEPGKLFSYSNAGYALLGILIEEKSGMSYSRYIRENIFEPAGMEDSLVYPAERNAALPLGYGMGDPLPPPHIRDMAAGSLLVSSRDMMRFADALFSNKIIREETWQDMIRVQNDGNRYDRSFSIGLSYWLINPLGTGDRIAAHGGDLPPFQALLVIMPQRKSAVYAAANDFSAQKPLAMETGMKMLEDLLEYQERAPLAEQQTAPARSFGFSGDPAQLAGTYNTAVGPIEILEKNGEISMVLMGKKLYLSQNDLGWWKPELRVLGIPLKIAALEALSLDMFMVDGEAWIGLWSGGIYGGAYRKIEDPGKPDEFALRTGKWKAVDSGEFLQEIEIRETRDYYLLLFDFLGNPVNFILQPIGPNLARTAGEGRFVGDELKFSREGDRDLLEYSGITFER